ncbi:hypothetical protein ABT127_07040 [Streptomyces sp. NPDC001904]|uniref:hypothetical protein n=1 Tax=Streptomyces sp. NPDC001904 TaxID=3154531 RepID=UPI00331B0033
MDSTVVTAAFTMIGVLAGVAGTYFAPVMAERRRQRGDQAARDEDRAEAQLARYVAARTTVDVLIDLLDRAHYDLQLSRFDPERFDEKYSELSNQLRAQQAELIHLGVPVRAGNYQIGSTNVFRTLFKASQLTLYAAVLPGGLEPRRFTVMQEALAQCREQRDIWSLNVLDAIAKLPGSQLGDREVDRMPRLRRPSTRDPASDSGQPD